MIVVEVLLLMVSLLLSLVAHSNCWAMIDIGDGVETAELEDGEVIISGEGEMSLPTSTIEDGCCTTGPVWLSARSDRATFRLLIECPLPNGECRDSCCLSALMWPLLSHININHYQPLGNDDFSINSLFVLFNTE